MEFSFLIIILLTSLISPAWGKLQQDEDFAGTYMSAIDNTMAIYIRKEYHEYFLEFPGQGKVRAEKAGKDRFRATRVNPKAYLEFKRDDRGKITGFKWVQKLPKFSFVRMESGKPDTVSGRLSKYVGNYMLSSKRGRMMRVRIKNERLTAQFFNEGTLVLTQVSDTRFTLVHGDLQLTFDFIADEHHRITAVNLSRVGSPEFVKTSHDTGPDVYGFERGGKFTRRDSLRGKLTPLRTCYDVLFYNLNVTVDPLQKSITGNNKIRFRVITPFDRIQVDLFANMRIEKILFRNTELSFTRESNAVFIRFPVALETGTVDEIDIVYAGKPQTPDASVLAGGILWLWDKDGEDWIETVTQGSGASLWWPCKDHLSDKPDSMRISATVPKGLTDISNGRLRRVKELPNNQTRFEWYVSNPITTYCVALNIGSYIRLRDEFIRGGDTLNLNYYSKPYDLAIGKNIFRQVKSMLSVFEKYFGKYPFAIDDFTILESIYPMEHQNAVTFGPVFNPFFSDSYDSTDVLRTLWHEAAHEWWGNNITVKDFADLWIHEAFATYAEVLAYESLDGKIAAEKYLRDQKPANTEAIIGTYDVNDFRLGDMYPKGALMLHTLRNVISNDSAWFDLLRGIQSHFSLQYIDTKELVDYVNEKLQTDFTYFFDQYLRYPAIPKLEWRITDGRLTYRWKADVRDFRMPIKVTTAPSVYNFIYPTQEWQTMDVDIKPKDFKVDVVNFYAESSQTER